VRAGARLLRWLFLFAYNAAATNNSAASTSSIAQNAHVGHSPRRSPITADATRPAAIPQSATAIATKAPSRIDSTPSATISSTPHRHAEAAVDSSHLCPALQRVDNNAERREDARRRGQRNEPHGEEEHSNRNREIHEALPGMIR